MSYLTTPTKCGGKRLRKQKSSISKKKKLDSGVSDSVPTNESTSTDEEEEEGGGDDIDWKKLEQALEESAQKANLTAVNVKSILHVRIFISLSY